MSRDPTVILQILDTVSLCMEKTEARNVNQNAAFFLAFAFLPFPNFSFFSLLNVN